LNKKLIRYFNCRVLKNHTLQEGELWVQGDKIVSPQDFADEEIDVHGWIVAPGYIDLHINGGFGIDFSEEGERVIEVAKSLPKYGVTAFLPTVISSSSEQYQKNLPRIRKKMGVSKEGAKILGIHLEGPFLNRAQSKAHNPAFVQPCSSPEKMYGSLEGVKIVTLAPELAGSSEIIAFLHGKGIIASAGHTEATDQQLQEAKERGLRFVTHLYNAMPPFHHRNPAAVGYVLTRAAIPYSVIADHAHLHPQALELAWRMHPEGLIVITDAMAALGLPPGSYSLGKREVEVKGERAVIKETEIIAGSVIGMDSAVRYLRSSTNCSIVEALEAATLKPAELLGIQKEKGTLQEGSDADFLFLDDDLFVQDCYIGGKTV
jgi:N-acetylglucosamine-6-phosphate deacetylase